jgi:hypothetical protein
MSDLTRTRLIRLPSGDWIDPRTVEGIRAFAPDTLCGRHFLARVTIQTAKGAYGETFPAMDEARAFVDDLARQVNEAPDE